MMDESAEEADLGPHPQEREEEGRAWRQKWTFFAAKVVANTSLYTSKGCLFVFLLISVPTFLGSFTNFLELALFYLMVLTYFTMFWIWPSKHLLVALEEMEPRNFLPWILSAMVHSVIIYGLYALYGTLDIEHLTSPSYLGPILVSAVLVFLPQVIIWMAWAEVTREKQRQDRDRARWGDLLAGGPGQGQLRVLLPEEGLGVSRIPAGCDEPPPPYSSVVCQEDECEGGPQGPQSYTQGPQSYIQGPPNLGPPPPYSQCNLEKEEPPV